MGDSTVQGRLIVVHPGRLELTPAGRLVFVLGLPSAIGFLLVAELVLPLLGMSREERPEWLRFALVGVALAPGLLWILHPRVGRLRAVRWMLADPQPAARLDDIAIELNAPGNGTQRYEWELVRSLEPGSGWRESARLVGTAGTVLARVPEALVHPRSGWRRSQTLAEAVVTLRPDRYKLDHVTWAGIPDGFTLASATEQAATLATARRRRTAVFAAIAVLLPPLSGSDPGGDPGYSANASRRRRGVQTVTPADSGTESRSESPVTMTASFRRARATRKSSSGSRHTGAMSDGSSTIVEPVSSQVRIAGICASSTHGRNFCRSSTASISSSRRGQTMTLAAPSRARSTARRRSDVGGSPPAITADTIVFVSRITRRLRFPVTGWNAAVEPPAAPS